MMMPKTISAWCLWLFFLWYGLSIFVTSLAGPPISYIGGLLALGYAVFAFMGK